MRQAFTLPELEEFEKFQRKTGLTHDALRATWLALPEPTPEPMYFPKNYYPSVSEIIHYRQLAELRAARKAGYAYGVSCAASDVEIAKIILLVHGDPPCFDKSEASRVVNEIIDILVNAYCLGEDGFDQS